MSKIRKSLGRLYEISIDTAPSPCGRHRRVRLLHDSRVIADLHISVFKNAVKAFEDAQAAQRVKPQQ